MGQRVSSPITPLTRPQYAALHSSATANCLAEKAAVAGGESSIQTSVQASHKLKTLQSSPRTKKRRYSDTDPKLEGADRDPKLTKLLHVMTEDGAFDGDVRFAVGTEDDLIHLYQRKHEPALRQLLIEMKQCLNSIEINSNLMNSRWEKMLRTGIHILENFAWPSIWTLDQLRTGRARSDPRDEMKGAVYTTSLELLKYFQSGNHLTMPTVIRDKPPLVALAHSSIIDHFLGRLEDRFDNGQINVQDPTISAYKEFSARQLPTAEVVARLRQPRQLLDNEHLPYNLLDLHDIMERQVPTVLQMRQFDLINSLSHRVLQRGRSDSESLAGKIKTDKASRPMQNAAGETYIDFHSCKAFNLFAQRGAVSGCHVDWLDGTWARLLTELKAWPVMIDLTPEELADFMQKGGTYLPQNGRMKMIVLEPGDILIMPPGTLTVHAPITIEDSLMDGGMFWDDNMILPILKHVSTVAKNPIISNEPVARQFAMAIDELEKWVQSDTKRFAGDRNKLDFLQEFHTILADLKTAMACNCIRACQTNTNCYCHKHRSGCTHWCTGHKGKRHCLSSRKASSKSPTHVAM